MVKESFVGDADVKSDTRIWGVTQIVEALSIGFEIEISTLLGIDLETMHVTCSMYFILSTFYVCI